jgi:hypothetical protein
MEKAEKNGTFLWARGIRDALFQAIRIRTAAWAFVENPIRCDVDTGRWPARAYHYTMTFI